MEINFQKANINHQQIIFEWLEEPHVKEFWDNSPEHKDDIINFVNGRNTPSNYFDGIFTYWIGLLEEVPFAFLMTSEVLSTEDIDPLWRAHLSTTGHTYTIDFCIGNKQFLGQGLASATLEAFSKFFKLSVDNKVEALFIDPDESNSRAKHVYNKAGFELVGSYLMGDSSVFKGKNTYLMVKKC